MRSACLAVTENKEAHTAENYRSNVDEVLEDFKIKEKVLKTVTDNENKMRAAFDDDERSGCLAPQPPCWGCRKKTTDGAAHAAQQVRHRCTLPPVLM